MRNGFRRLVVILIVLMVVGVIGLAEVSAAAWTGSGTQASPYLIANESSLRQLATNVNGGNSYSGKYFRLSADIALTQEWTPIGTSGTAFCGTFDGNGKTISGMTATGSNTGLFAYVGSGATIKGVCLTDFSVSGPSYLAGLVARANAGTGSITIDSCQVNGTLRDTLDSYPNGYLAGIVAYADAQSGSITIQNCTSAGSYICDYYSGGIVGCGKGSAHSLKLQSCVNRAYINADDDANNCGGIAGYLDSAELVRCINYGSVSGNGYSEDNGSSWLGGISGSGDNQIFIGCANYGTVTTFFAGGITPAQYGSHVVNSCLNVGHLYHSSDGYGAALNYSGTTINSYYLAGCGGAGRSGSTAASSAEMASGAVAHSLREYFGQTIGVDSYPVPLTSSNRVFRVTVVGDVEETYYVNYGATISLPELSSCAAYFDGASKFDPLTAITRDYALVAKGYHAYVDGVCTYCGNDGVDYIDAGACGESISWLLTKDGVLTISGSGAMTNYSSGSPAPWKGYASSITSVEIGKGITAVGSYAFAGLTKVTAVQFPDTVTTIGAYGFYGLTGLSAVTVGSAVTAMESYAFYGCTGLTSLTLGKQLKTVGAYAFGGCVGLQSVSIPSNVTTLGSGAFKGCTALSYLYLYDGLTEIGSYALSETGLTSLRIPATVEKIGENAFASCTALTQVTFSGTAPEIAGTAFSGRTVTCLVPNYDSSWQTNVQKHFGGTLTWAMGGGSCGSSAEWVLDFNGTLTVFGTGAMSSYSATSVPWASLRDKIQSVVISEGITSVGDYAFFNCSNLRSVSIADSVTKIGNLTTSTYSYTCTFAHCTSLTQITIPKNVTEIAYSSFYGCSKLTAINVASGNTAYTSVDGVLYDRYKQTIHSYPGGKTGVFTIPSGVTQIAAYAFAEHVGLTQITIPSSVTTIGREAFEDCANLKKITFEGSAPTSIGSYSFLSVTADAYFPAGDTSWTTSVMKKCGSSLAWHVATGDCGTGVRWELTYTKGAGALTVSGTGAMDDYTYDTIPWKSYLADIQTFTVNNGVTYVGANVLSGTSSVNGATGLTTVSLADSVTAIGDDAFWGATSLWNITWSNNLQTIGESAFGCTALTSITFPDSVKTIGRFSFQSCTKLRSLTIGSGVQSIGYTAFAGCTSLQTVDLGSRITTLEQSAFNGCTGLTSMVIPASVTTVGTYAFRNCTNLMKIEFLGNAPTFNSNAFAGTTCHAYYLPSSSGWTSSVLANYGGTITWGALSQRGSCGTNAQWILSSAGNLYIFGSGSMSSYSADSDVPWHPYRAAIKSVSFRGVTSIAAYAFRGCGEIVNITVPEAIRTVGTYAFADCGKLQVAVFEGSAPGFGENAFSGTNCEIWYQSAWASSVCKDYGGTLTWRKTNNFGQCGTGTMWALDTTGTMVMLGTGDMASYSSSYRPWYSIRTNIKELVIKDGVTKITGSAFSGCTALEKVTVGTGVTYIDTLAFSGCTSLGEVTFYGNAPGIAYNAFSGVTATVYYPLTNATWTSNVMWDRGGTLTWQGFCISHSETVAPAVSPTCTDTGLTEGIYCSLCNEFLVAQEVIPAKGHFALNAENVEVPADTLQPDCLNGITCTVCRKTLASALGHRVLEKVSVEKDPLTIDNTATYPFTLTSGIYYSTNNTSSTSSTLRITAQYDCTLTLTCGVSSESNFDKLYVYQNGVAKLTISGEVTDNALTLALKSGDVVQVSYTKDGSVDKGQDMGWFALAYDTVVVESTRDIPASTIEPDCTNAVVCAYCQTVVKEALGHRVILQLPEPEAPYDVVNTSNYPYTLTGGVYYSGNKGISSSASEIQFCAKSDCTVTLRYGVSSEQSYDKLTILLNNTTKATVSGLVSNQILTLTLNTGDVIAVRYSKDSSVNKNDDRGWVSVEYDRGPTEQIVPADSLEADCDGITCDYCQVLVKEGLGHNHTSAVTAPTCTEKGYTTYTCHCGDTYTADETAALGHEPGSWTEVTAPTCTVEGQERRECARCDYFETQSIPATGHSHTSAVTAPTCAEKGYTTYTCHCGDTYTADETAALGHSYESLGMTAPGEKTEQCHCGSSNAILVYGWSLFGGNWYFRETSGELVRNSWRKDSRGWCWLTESGAMATNQWVRDSKGWCYVEADGYCATNCWKKDSIGWIWLDSEGSMTKNAWILDGGKWYYLDGEGYMVTGKQCINGTWYTFEDSGVWVG